MASDRNGLEPGFPVYGWVVSSVSGFTRSTVLPISTDANPRPLLREGAEELLTCSTLPLLPMLWALPPPGIVFTTPALE